MLQSITKFATPVVNAAKKAAFAVKKASPEIMLASGIIIGTIAIISACNASRHVDEVIDEAKEELDTLDNIVEFEGTNKKREALKIYANTGWKLVKLYYPSFLMGLSSVGLILGSHGILRKRYAGMAATANALNEAFMDYKKRVAELIGEDAEKVLSMGGEGVKNVKTVDENGEVQTLKDKQIVIKNKSKSPYEFDFNCFTAPDTWSDNPTYIMCFLKAQQNYANELLRARGHVFLNEVLDMLGLDRTPEGAVTGWFKGAPGDGYIDFGMTESYFPDYQLDTDLCKKNIHFNFNVDGLIYDMI